MNEWMNEAIGMKYWEPPSIKMKKINKSIMLSWVDTPPVAFSTESLVTV